VSEEEVLPGSSGNRAQPSFLTIMSWVEGGAPLSLRQKHFRLSVKVPQAKMCHGGKLQNMLSSA
jgi:hypothetical protein